MEIKEILTEKLRNRYSTAEEADAESHTTADAEAKGGTQLPELMGFDYWKLPQQTLLLSIPRHLSPTLLVRLSESQPTLAVFSFEF